LYFLKAGAFGVAEGNWQPVWLLLAVLGSFAVALYERRLAPILLLWLPVLFYTLSRRLRWGPDLHARLVAVLAL